MALFSMFIFLWLFVLFKALMRFVRFIKLIFCRGKPVKQQEQRSVKKELPWVNLRQVQKLIGQIVNNFIHIKLLFTFATFCISLHQTLKWLDSLSPYIIKGEMSTNRKKQISNAG